MHIQLSRLAGLAKFETLLHWWVGIKKRVNQENIDFFASQVISRQALTWLFRARSWNLFDRIQFLRKILILLNIKEREKHTRCFEIPKNLCNVIWLKSQCWLQNARKQSSAVWKIPKFVAVLTIEFLVSCLTYESKPAKKRVNLENIDFLLVK